MEQIMLPSNLQKIINDVSRVNKEAGEWLKDILLNLDEHIPEYIRDIDDYVDNVDNLLVWNETPQGSRFWEKMNRDIDNLSTMNRNGANS